MELLDKYLNYWPVLAGTLVFFVLAWVLYLRGERAMERSAKDVSWIRAYRKEGWPMRAEVLAFRPRHWLIFAGLGLFGAAASVGYRVLSGEIFLQDTAALLLTRYTVFAALVSAFGAVAAGLLLQMLFDDTLVLVMGSLLLSASSLCSHPALCLLTGAVWLLVCYLRTEAPELKQELLYYGSVLLLALTLSIQPQNFWLILVWIGLHVYKNAWLLHHNRQTAGLLWGKLGLAALVWAVSVVALLAWRYAMLQNFSARMLLRVLKPTVLLRALSTTARMALAGFVQPLMRSRLLYPMMDAPLFGLGVFGAASALRMVAKRRNVRGVVALAALCVLALAWILNAKYLVTLGFVLTGACLLKNCRIGRCGRSALLVSLAGLVWYVALYLAAAYLPLAAELIIRLS